MVGQALAGMKVLQVGEGVGVAFAAKLLADLGADVVIVEPPGGSSLRNMGPFARGPGAGDESGALFTYLNANKKGITLNPKHKRALGIIRKLVLEFDVLIEEYTPRHGHPLGLTYETLSQLNPRLIHIATTPFGETGPYRDFEESDLICRALATTVFHSGLAGHPPLLVGRNISAYFPGLYAAGLAIALYYQRRRNGRGEHVDLSKIECLINLSASSALEYAYTGGHFSRGYRRSNQFPAPVWPCKDGYIGFTLMTQAQWEQLCVLVGHPELVEDPRFRDPLSRTASAAEAEHIIGPWFKERTMQECFTLGQELRVPIAPVLGPGELLRDPQHRARSYWTNLSPVEDKPLEAPGAPFHLPSSAWAIRSAAPRLGEHNEQVLCGQLGLSNRVVGRLRSQGVI